jgi:hypothetical protein
MGINRSLQVDLLLDRAAVRPGDEFYAAVGPPEISGRPDPGSVALVLAVDASGSMREASFKNDDGSDGPPKWQVATQGFGQVIRGVEASTAVAVVRFDEHSHVVFKGSAGTAQTKGNILSEPPDGMTDIGAAIRKSVETLEELGGVSRRVILLSDGLPTAGVQDPQGLARLAREASQADIYFDTIGCGAEAGIDLLRGIAGPTGRTEHIRGNAADSDSYEIGRLLLDLTNLGQGAIVSGGEIDVAIHPQFKLLGVYLAHPEQRRTDVDLHDDKLLRLSLGAQGAGDARPTYILRLRAPEAPTTAAIKILAASGLLRFGSRQEPLQPPDESRASITIRADAVDYDPRLRKLVDEIEEGIRVRDELAKVKDPAQKLQVLRTALLRAKEAGFQALIESHAQAIAGLEEGLDVRDVDAKYVTTSSKSTTRPSDLLRGARYLEYGRRPRKSLEDL